MTKEESGKLPWRHRPFPELARLAWPIAVSMLSYSFMTLTGTLFVSRLGATALAGVGLGGVASFTVLCFGFGYLRGVKVAVSQAVGRGRPGEVPAWLTGGLIYALGFGVLMVLVGELMSTFVAELADSAEAGANAAVYLRIRMLGAPVMMAFVAIREVRYGVGDMRGPMIATVAGNATNIVLDYFLIMVFDQGVAGAAVGTLAGHSVELLVLMVRSRRSLRLARPSLVQMKELVRLGLPTGIQFWLEVGSFGLLTVIVASFGDVQLAAHQVSLQIAHLAFLPTAALAEAASVLAGQAMGAGEVRLVRQVARLGLMGALVYSAICGVMYLTFGGPIASAFTDDPELHGVIVRLVAVIALFQIPDGAAVVARGVLRGTGDVRFPAVVGVTVAWVCTPPLAWLLGHHLEMGALGGWMGLALEIAVSAALFWWRLERAHWLPIARVARARLRLADAMA